MASSLQTAQLTFLNAVAWTPENWRDFSKIKGKESLPKFSAAQQMLKFIQCSTVQWQPNAIKLSFAQV